MATPIEIVTGFLGEWEKGAEPMYQSYRDYFTPETVWENVGLSTTTGIYEAVALIHGFEEMYGVGTTTVELLHIAATGNTVLTERIDRLLSTEGQEVMAIRLMGIFELEGDKIVRWREYCDLSGLPKPAA